MDTDVQKYKERLLVSDLIFDVLTSKKTVAEVLKFYPKNFEDESLQCAFFALVHYEADEDIRKKDCNYKDLQNEYLEEIAYILKKGENIPQNIIDEYKPYHNEFPIFPILDKKTILQRLKKAINLW